jgi:hypothetical protein
MKPFASKDIGFSAIQESVRKAIAPLKESMRKAREAMMPIFERMRELPDQVKVLLSQLAEMGWFLPLDFLLDLPVSALDSLTESIESESDAEIDRSIAKFYTKRLDEVLNNLITVFSERKHLFQSAFKAHKRKEYDLSIPILLAQADGVCLDMLGVKLYSRREGIPVTKNALTMKIGCLPVGEIVDSFFEPLRSGSAFSLGKDKVKEKREYDTNYKVLNRHEVMHGIDVDYGNEVNGLKAISQLYYLTSVKKSLENHEKNAA